MTHKALNQPWTEEEIATVKQIMEGNPDLKPGEKIALAAKTINRTPNGVQFKWHTHIKKIRAAEDTVVSIETPLPKKHEFVTKKNVTAYVDMKGQYHLLEADAIQSNINHILEQMEVAENIYTWLMKNKEKIDYLYMTKKND